MTVIVFLTLFTIVIGVSILWVKGIDDMTQNWPNYKGEDFLDEHPPKKDDWDDNKIHAEGDHI